MIVTLNILVAYNYYNMHVIHVMIHLHDIHIHDTHDTHVQKYADTVPAFVRILINNSVLRMPTKFIGRIWG